jgi:4-alpha-glucanotransferase
MPEIFDFSKRRAGILLHITSLPGTVGNGDLGDNAENFVDFLQGCGLSMWQVLPIHPTPSADLSPYQPLSVHAGNPLFINLELLARKGWLFDLDPPKFKRWPDAINYRHARLRDAYQGFSKRASDADHTAFDQFTKGQAPWLDDYSLFCALKDDHANKSWWEWQPGYRDRQPEALAEARTRLAEAIAQYRFEQFVFFQQWQALKEYAHDKDVYLFGDMPFFVARDSVEVWANRKNFLLDDQGQPTFMAGSPPEYFVPRGQCWNNPLYDWEYLQTNDFQWWIERFKTLHTLVDVARLTHFRGFEACWAIPVTDPPTPPAEGQWRKSKGRELFQKLKQVEKEWGSSLALMAEEIGITDEEVIKLRNDKEFNFAGMKILQLAFARHNELGNPHLPHRHQPRYDVVYTATHDGNTTKGWFFKDLTPEQQKYVCNYLHAERADMPWPLIQAAFSSCAKLAVIPMQDVLALDADHRMNIPGTSNDKNWCWQFKWTDVQAGLREKWRQLAEDYERN